MKTLKFLIISGSVLIANFTIAQDFPTSIDNRDILQFGITGGFNNSNVYDVQGQGFSRNSMLGPVFGGFLSVPFCTYLGIQPEVLYSEKGYTGRGMTQEGQVYSFANRLNYLDVPLLLQIKPQKNLYLLAGAEYSYLLSSSYIFTQDLTSENTQQQIANTKGRRSIFGIVVGFDFILTPSFTIGGRVAWDEQDNNAGGATILPYYRNFCEQFILGFRI